tara:strand:- start:1550 stop:1753 length:204 start_codon:yes stop_codon:yes gene_type:complete
MAEFYLSTSEALPMTKNDYINKAIQSAIENDDFEVADQLELEQTRALKDQYMQIHQDRFDDDTQDLY